MIKYLFPYELVPQGARIILYGFGNAGKDYFAQMQYTKYCHVIKILDKNVSSIQNGIVDIVPPSVEALDVQYDYIVVSVVRKLDAYSIKRTLIEYGIPETKIILSLRNEIMGIQCSNEAFKKIIEKPESFHGVVKDYFLLGEGKISYFLSIVIRFSKGEPATAKKWIEQIMRLDFSNEEKVIALIIMVYAKMIDEDGLKDLMHRIIKLDASKNAIFDAGIFLTYQTLYRPKAIYDGFFLDWRRYLKELACAYKLKLRTITPRKKDKLERIVICKISPGTRFNTGGYYSVVQDVANSLEGAGYDVALAPNDLQIQYVGESFLFPFLSSGSLNTIDEEGKNGIRPGVKIFHRNEATVQGRMQGLVDDICNFNPDLIIDLMDDFSPHTYVLKDVFPILYFPVRGCAMGSYFHRYITADLRKSEADDIRHGTGNTGKFIEHKSAGVIPYDDTCCYTRAQFGFDKDNFIIVTVGSRLEVEVNDDLGVHMKSFLERNPKAVWLLVGNEPGLKLPIYEELKEKRQIIYWGVEKELVSLYKLCDVYLNPDRLGGGMSIRIAMQYGVAIAMLNRESDAMPAVGAENTIDGGYEELVAYVESLMQNSELLHSKSNLMLQRINGIVNKNDELQHFVDICKETMRSFYAGKEV